MQWFIERRWLFTALILILMAIMTTVLTIGWMSAVERSNRGLANQELPLFEQVQQLRAALAEQTLNFHEYYLSGDAEAFALAYREDKKQIELALINLQAGLDRSASLADLQHALAQLELIARRMHEAMAPPTSWDDARSVLAEFTPLTDELNAGSLAMVMQIEARVNERIAHNLEYARRSLLWAGLLATGLLLALLFNLTLDVRRRKAQLQQKRFAGFPERNPRPVLSLDARGMINYANPAAEELASSLSDAGASVLLPPDMDEFMQRAKDGIRLQQWEQCIGERYFEGVLHWLNDLQEYRLYYADISDRKAAEQHLKDLAFLQPLTGLPNRQALKADLSATSTPYNLALLDLLTLPQLTSRAGPSAADVAIREFANRLQTIAEQHDLPVYHFEGKHFCVLMTGIAMEHCLNIISSIQQHLSQSRVVIAGLEFSLGLAIGITPYKPEVDAEILLKQANVALRTAYPKGGVVEYDEQLECQLAERLDLENALKNAVHNQELELWFQPKIRLKDQQVSGAEALLRWRREDGTLVSPSIFIPLAEETGLINEIGDWVLARGCEVAARWQQLQPLPPRLALNLAAEQLLCGHIVTQMQSLLSDLKIPAQSIELEITESAALYDMDKAVITLKALGDLGLHLALDDFGTGYSAFSYLTQLPLNTLKIDQSFIRHMLDDQRHEAVVRAIIALARPLGLEVTAEGVESAEQKAMLERWQCHEIQGYLIARPMPLVEFERWLGHYQIPAEQPE